MMNREDLSHKQFRNDFLMIYRINNSEMTIFIYLHKTILDHNLIFLYASTQTTTTRFANRD